MKGEKGKGFQKGKTARFLVVPILLVLGFTVYYFLYYNIAEGANNKNFQFILDHTNSQGVLVDIKNEIGVSSVDDVKLFVLEDSVELKFGYLEFKWSIKDFTSKETQEMLERIGIECKVYGEPKKLHLFYRGEEIKRWVR